jgi:hypothetical protein
MDKPWYRKLFAGSPKLEVETTPVPVADRNDAEVQFGLGMQCASGEGVPQDYALAAEWYRKAAAQSHSLAQFNLGVMYAAGQGVEQDDAQSMSWFQKAARQGDAGAQFKLGRGHFCLSIRGLPQDAAESRIEAYKWYRLATAQGYRSTDAYHVGLILKMTRADVALGADRATHFVAEKAMAARPLAASLKES